MFCKKKSVFWSWSRSEPSFYRWSRSRIFYMEQEPKKNYLKPEPRKKGSDPQHWLFQRWPAKVVNYGLSARGLYFTLHLSQPIQGSMFYIL